jgi:hypothetical protein
MQSARMTVSMIESNAHTSVSGASRSRSSTPQQPSAPSCSGSSPKHANTRSAFVATSRAAWSSLSVQTSRTAITAPSRLIVQPACCAASSSVAPGLPEFQSPRARSRRTAHMPVDVCPLATAVSLPVRRGRGSAPSPFDPEAADPFMLIWRRYVTAGLLDRRLVATPPARTGGSGALLVRSPCTRRKHRCGR